MKNHTEDSIYLDYAASTPMRDEVISAMKPYWQDVFANPQSVHQAGRQAHDAVGKSRNGIAETLSVQPTEIVFTSGASEANSLALCGAGRAFSAEKNMQPEILISEITHPSVANISSSSDTDTTQILVDSSGQIQIEQLTKKLSPSTAVVSISHANSEIGTLQPVRRIAKAVKAYRKKQGGPYPLLHIDASQTGLFKNISPHHLGADLLTLNGHKLYGPKGVGVLWVRSGTPMRSIFISETVRRVGDYQQLRPGTPPTPLIVGFAEAVKWAQQNFENRAEKIDELRDYFRSRLKDDFSDIRINGSEDHHVPHIVSVTFDTDHDYLAVQLDSRGVYASTTSACQARQAEGSAVIQAVSDTDQALRFSLGVDTTQADIDRTVEYLSDIC